jgi:ubiquinone/menaquinone biosynthesis C-methylase UbiE
MSYLSDPQFVKTQYKDSANLDARIALHARYSRNPQEWMHWVFEQLWLPPACRVLELGCGSGVFWQKNRERIPAGWEIILSDFSLGMTRRAREILRGMQPEPRFAQISAERLPFASNSLDAVIANHMLYHVPDRAAALAEIRRVLRPDGRLLAATNGEQHMRELDQLACEFDPQLNFGDPRLTVGFTLENGTGQLADHFSQV